MKISELEKEIDKVYVTEKEFKKASKFTAGRQVSEMLDMRLFFPLKTFVIDVQLDKTTNLKALVELDTFNPTSGRITTDDYWFTYKREKENKRTRIDGQGADRKTMEVAHVFIVTMLIYICLQSRERVVKERVEHKKSNGHTYEYKDRECFLLNDIIEYVGAHPNRKSIQYQCECWGVRGHIRHLTDGRVQFVRPYKKGRKRDILEPKSKTYLLGGKDERD